MPPNARYSQHNKEKEGNEIKWIYLQNQNSFPKSFFHFQNLHKTYNILKKKNWSSYLKSFGSDSIRKTGKVSGIRGLVSEHHSAVNVLTYTNTAQVCQRKLLLDVFIILTWINLEKTSFIQVSNLRTVCKSIASQCSLFSRW